MLPNDLLVVEADPQALEQFIADGKLEVAGSEELPEVPEGTAENLGRASQARRRSGAGASWTQTGSLRSKRWSPPIPELIGRSAADLHLRETIRRQRAGDRPARAS